MLFRSVNRNDLLTGMKQIVRDSSAYYLVGYTSQAATDGKFHEIKVKVKRPGLQVRSRKGFWAYTAEDARRALAPAKAGPRAEVTKALGEKWKGKQLTGAVAAYTNVQVLADALQRAGSTDAKALNAAIAKTDGDFALEIGRAHV